MVTVTPITINERDEAKAYALTAATAASNVYGAKYHPSLDSGRTTVIVANGTSGGGAKKISINLKANDTQFGLDKEIEIASGGTVAITVDNGKHKNILGAEKGFVLIESDDPFSVAVIEAAI